MKQIATFSNIESAYIASGMLQAHGIVCNVTQNALNTVFPAPDAYNGGITLTVADADAEKAIELLKKHGDLH